MQPQAKEADLIVTGVTVLTMNPQKPLATAFEESEKGTIEPGKWADFVVLEKDPRTVRELSLKDVAVERTVVGGKTVYDQTGRSTEPAQYSGILPDWEFMG
jgi:cytosine/adenosine deaminase-related metal-dependent hydrolase